MNKHKGKVRVFVYGTLKLNHSNNVILNNRDTTFMGHDFIEGHYRMIELGNFPAIIYDPKAPVTRIFGQVFATNDDGLAACDLLEGHPRFYERTKIRTKGRDLRAWVYCLKEPERFGDHDEITTGIWNPLDLELAFWESETGQKLQNNAD